MYYFVWFLYRLAPFGPVWCLALFGPVCSRLTLFGLVWPCLASFCPDRPRLAQFSLVGLFWPCLALLDPIWPCLTPFGPVLPCMTWFDTVLYCFSPKNNNEPFIKDNPKKEDSLKKKKPPKNGNNTKNNMAQK